MGPRNAYKDMLDNVVSPITYVSMNHQNQLEQMANGAMFAIAIFSFLQRWASSSSGCINWSSASLWVPFYRIILGFNIQAHRWGFV
jgi:hypothetical protein